MLETIASYGIAVFLANIWISYYNVLLQFIGSSRQVQLYRPQVVGILDIIPAREHTQECEWS